MIIIIIIIMNTTSTFMAIDAHVDEERCIYEGIYSVGYMYSDIIIILGLKALITDNFLCNSSNYFSCVLCIL